MKSSIALSLAFALAMISSASAQQFVYPAKGQSPEQQKSDESACHSWAVQQTGVDPSNPKPQQQAAGQPTTATGASRGSGARGAARGAVVGELVADDARSGAAVGAVAARGQSRRQNAAANQQAQQQQQAAGQQQSSAYSKARAACLEGRGYSVK